MTRRLCIAGGAALALVLASGWEIARAEFVTGDLYYTRFSGEPNVREAAYTYDGATFQLGAKTDIASVNGADGLVFDTQGNLIVGGQGNSVHKINVDTGAVRTVNAGGTNSFHVSMDPS